MKHLLYALILAGTAASAQDEEFIKTVGEDACPCMSEISFNQKQEEILEAINSCITVSTLKTQLMGLKLPEEEVTAENAETKKDTTKVTYTVVADKNFDEIQTYLYNNCDVVKALLAANNDLSKKSMSKNKKALAFYEEGQKYSANEQYDMAIVSYNKAVKADPKFAFAWDNLGISYRKMGNYKEAIKCYKKSLEVDPNGTMPLQNMAVAYEYLKDYKQAAETYEKFISLYPNDPEGYYGAARTYYVSNNYQKGVDYMFKAYLLYSEQKSPYVNDAVTNIRLYYADLKEKNKLDIFLEAAKKHNIELNDE